MKYRMKIYRVKGEVLVAVCDEELIGRNFKEGELKIEIREEFYGEKSYEESEVKKMLRQATIANISGERAVKLAISMGIVDENRVLKIGECWHAQMVVM
ncbi:DUF424 family protein [Geoglobus acetivorans]|uniref:DUF424 family protein n=1 Tax=Geoglobus acetivorans TaxID=565033 RepID=A0ABZ3H0X8_GEOAI|nr:DUF424 family protein [Geoglobus acetivorans]